MEIVLLFSDQSSTKKQNLFSNTLPIPVVDLGPVYMEVGDPR